MSPSIVPFAETRAARPAGQLDKIVKLGFATAGEGLVPGAVGGFIFVVNIFIALALCPTITSLFITSLRIAIRFGIIIFNMLLNSEL
jgi:hypothetical protein